MANNLRHIILVVAIVMAMIMSAHAMEPDVVVDTIDDIETEMMFDTEISGRQLYRTRYISYEALKRNSIPCGRHGRSYYDCSRRRSANKWRRGCSRITYCVGNSEG